MEFDNLNDYKEQFLRFLIENEISNFSFIKSIKFNKKSITCKYDNLDIYNHDFYNDIIMLSIILKHLSNFIKENNINYSYDIDFLKYKFGKINFYKIN